MQARTKSQASTKTRTSHVRKSCCDRKKPLGSTNNYHRIKNDLAIEKASPTQTRISTNPRPTSAPTLTSTTTTTQSKRLQTTNQRPRRYKLTTPDSSGRANLRSSNARQSTKKLLHTTNQSLGIQPPATSTVSSLHSRPAHTHCPWKPANTSPTINASARASPCLPPDLIPSYYTITLSLSLRPAPVCLSTSSRSS